MPALDVRHVPRRALPVAGLLRRAEQRPVLGVFLVALGVRAIVAVAITVGWGGSLFLDDASYSRLAQAAADGTLGRLGAYAEWLYTRTGTLLWPVTGLYDLLGPVKLSGQFYVALLGAATAALTARLAMEVVARRWALAAGLCVALLPSQILWSSIIMKDAAVWAVLSALAVVVAVAGRSTGGRLALLGLGAAGLLALLGFLRLHTLEVACVAVALSTLVSARPQRPFRVAGGTALLVCIPLAFSMGPAGVPFVSSSRNPALQRALNAQYANSAVIAPADNVDVAGTDVENELSYSVTGITVVALRPWPWESADGSTGVGLARLETVLWYPLVLLALVGLTTAWRRRRALAFPVVAGGAILVMYALTEGNLGTAFRHRGEVEWIVGLLAVLGAERCSQWWRERRQWAAA